MSSIAPFQKIDKIQLQNISKKYKDQYAVKDLDLEIRGGELLILIGSSGSGKTTTLKMINRLIEPTHGSITINGTDISDFEEVSLRRHIGYVIQDIGLFPHYTVAENIGIIPKLEGWRKEQIKQRTKTLLNFVDLPAETYGKRYPVALSGGQQQRVGLARALAMDPYLLLMDEPFGALDPILRKQLQQEFLKIKKELHRTIVFVTHDIDEAFTLGDRIGIMQNAELLQVGTPEELLFHPDHPLVAEIVDADSKFKHIDQLHAKEMMTKISEKHLFSAKKTVGEAMQFMQENDVEILILQQDHELRGIVTYSSIMKKNNDEKLIDNANEPLTFEANDSLCSSIQTMKKQSSHIALITKNNSPIGLLQANKVLFQLV
jgi:osmoprotectant transport system ATP-binding protein